MADEAEALIAGDRMNSWESPECVPAKSLNGTGEFKFSCVGEDIRCDKREKFQAIVYGSDSGKPELGMITAGLCDPVSVRGGRPHRSG